jgi:CRISPR-associated protein Cas2
VCEADHWQTQQPEWLMPRKLYLAAYDVRTAKRLKHALKVARQYARGGQKSAFECFLDAAEHADLLRNMAEAIDDACDSFALIAIDPRGAVAVLGKAVAPRDDRFLYFG